MHKVVLHQGINKMMESFRLIRLWHSADEPTPSERRIKLFYSIYYLLYLISIIVGAVTCDDVDESIFLAQTSVIAFVGYVKLLYLIWRQKEILQLLNRIGVHYIEDKEQFTIENKKLEYFMRYISGLVAITFFGTLCCALGIPFLGGERKQFLNIGFPFDWKTNELVYWIEFAFIILGAVLSMFSFLFSTLMWFLLFNCSLKYDILASQLRNMGWIRASDNAVNISERQKENLFRRDLINGIVTHKGIVGTTKDLGSLLYKMLSCQLATSAFCICCSTYCLAFKNNVEFIEFVVYLIYLLYNVYDIYMIMYYGNEIMVASGRLLYALFESNWVDRSQSCKKCIIIFGERLKKTEQLMLLILYPLTLDTFSMILNSAYSMFNILKNLKE